MEDVRVDAAVYRQKIIGKDGVFQHMRQNMWWFHKAARYTTVRGTRVPCGTLSGDKCNDGVGRGGSEFPDLGGNRTSCLKGCDFAQ